MKNFLLLSICLISFSVFSQNWDWIQTINGGGNNYVWDMTTDSNGDVIACGRVKFDVTFGTGGSSQFSTQLGIQTDIYVAKFDANGDLLWYRRSGHVNPDWARSVAVDDNDNIYVTGDFVNIGVFENDTIYGYDNGDTNPNTMARSGFVAKYLPNGDLVWVKSFQGTGHTRGYGITVDNIGQIYVSGYSTGICDFGGGVTCGDAVEDVGFIAKYDGNGIPLWANTLDSPFASRANDIEVLNSNTIVATGSYNSQLTYLGNISPGASPTWGDYFTLAVDSLGDFKWIQTGTGPFLNEGNGLTVDKNGGVYVVGRFAYEMELITGTETAIGVGSNTTEYIENGDAFLVKYDESGNQIWFNQIGNDWSDDFERATVCGSDVLVVGRSMDTLTFLGSNDSLIPDLMNHNSMVISYDTSGTYEWSHIVHSTAPQVASNYPATSGNAGQAISADPNGNIFVGGFFLDDAHFDGNTITAVSGYDAYLAKLFPPLGIDFAGSSPDVCPGDTVTYALSAKGSPLNYNWSSQIGNVINQSGTDVTVEYPVAGSDTLIGTASNGYENDSVVIYIDVNSNNCLSVDESFAGLIVYPNPTNGVFVIELEQISDEVEHFIIYDQLGKVVLSAPINSSKTVIDLSIFPKGLYVLNIVGSNRIMTTKKLIRL